MARERGLREMIERSALTKNEAVVKVEVVHAEALEALEFLTRLSIEGGAIVCSGAAHEIEIADARATGRWLCIDSIGYILRSKEWRERAQDALHDRVATGKHGASCHRVSASGQFTFPNTKCNCGLE